MGAVQRVNTRHYAKFRAYRSNCCWDTALFNFPKWRSSILALPYTAMEKPGAHTYKLTCRRPVSDVSSDVNDGILSAVARRAERAAETSAYGMRRRRHWIHGNVTEAHPDDKATPRSHAQPQVCCQQHQYFIVMFQTHCHSLHRVTTLFQQWFSMTFPWPKKMNFHELSVQYIFSK